jgi:hypothetical protein
MAYSWAAVRDYDYDRMQTGVRFANGTRASYKE